MPELAKNVTIRRNGVTIDGVEVPWYIADQSIDVTVPNPGVDTGVVYLPVLVDSSGTILADMALKVNAAEDPLLWGTRHRTAAESILTTKEH